MMKREIRWSSKFKSDYKKAKKRGLPMDKLHEMIELLANDEPLPLRCRNHQLSGAWAGHWECHVLPDWLLVYMFSDEALILTLVRTGTHSDLFDE